MSLAYFFLCFPYNMFGSMHCYCKESAISPYIEALTIYKDLAPFVRGESRAVAFLYINGSYECA